MAWRNIQTTDITKKFTVNEQALLSAASGAGSALQTHLTDTIGKFLGALSALGYNTAAGGAVPDQLRDDIMAYACWKWLDDFPVMKAMQTDQRKAAYEKAESNYERICKRDYGAIEEPQGFQKKGNWNCDNHIVGRTFPTPTPAQQFQTTQSSGSGKANSCGEGRTLDSGGNPI